MYKIAYIAIEKTTYSFDLLFSYVIPKGMVSVAEKGCRVLVPFGKGNNRRQGLIMDISEESSLDAKLKPIFLVIDETPIVNEEMLWLIAELKQRTFCTYFDAFRAILPSGLSVMEQQLCTVIADVSGREFSSQQESIISYLRKKKSPVPLEKLIEDFGIMPSNQELRELIETGIIEINETLKQKIQDERLAMIRLTEELTEEKKVALKLTKKQQGVIQFLSEVGFASIKEVMYFCAVTKVVITKLCEKGAVEVFYKEVFRRPKGAEFKSNTGNDKIVLTKTQQEIFSSIVSKLDSEKFSVELIYGVTGSGKTVIFIKLIEQVINKGKTAILLVPEISLTPQIISTFTQHFGEKVAVIHSGLSLSERMDEWKRINQGRAKVIIGTRSAVFAPCENLGIIILDEEHDSSYKSDKSPRYHARDVAMWRCSATNAQVVLSSATPSMESYYNAKRGKYHLHTLTERYQGFGLPQVYIVDMRDYIGNEKMFSQTLLDEIYENLKKKEQTILLINRRGYNTLIRCSSCGETASCPNCSVSLTYHRANGRLVCHHCGFQKNIVDNCELCKSPYIAYNGYGTQMVEEALKQFYPEARVLRMDMDTTMSRYSHEEKFADFKDQKYDIMIGTQMVAKGHNFPSVTLVGVIDADRSLFADDFRSCEKTFSLITQVIGRSGRYEKEGRAIIQTCYPDNEVINQAAEQNYIRFFDEEILMRKTFLYPPFCSIFMIGFSSVNREHVKAAAFRFAKKFVIMAKTKYSDLPMRLLGPCEPAIFKISGKYRYKLLLKCKNTKSMRELISFEIEDFLRDKTNKDVSIFVDPYYDSIM